MGQRLVRLLPAAFGLAALAGGAPAPAAPAPLALQFRKIALGGEPVAVAAADVSGDGLRDLVISHDTPQGRRVAIVRQRPDGGGFPESPDQSLVPPADAYALLVADLAAPPGDEVGYLCTDGVRIHPRAGSADALSPDLAPEPVRLIGAAGFVERAPSGPLVRWDGVHDLDGDGLPDLLLPQRAGYLCVFQGKDRGFSLVQALPIEPEERLLSRSFPLVEVDLCGASRMLPRLHPADFDGDGRLDLLALRRDMLTGFLGRGAGWYPPAPSFQESVAFLRPTVAAGTADEFERKRARFADLDGDRRTDMVVVATEGTIGLFSSIRTAVAVFRGREGALFAARPDQVLLLPGAPLSVEVADYTGDGQPDLLATTARTDLLGVALAGGISLTTRLYRGRPGVFLETPALEESVELSGQSLDGDRVAPQAVHDADCSGDGLVDLVTWDPEGRLTIRRTQTSPDDPDALALEPEAWAEATTAAEAQRLATVRATAPVAGVGSARHDICVFYAEALGIAWAAGAPR